MKKFLFAVLAATAILASASAYAGSSHGDLSGMGSGISTDNAAAAGRRSREARPDAPTKACPVASKSARYPPLNSNSAPARALQNP